MVMTERDRPYAREKTSLCADRQSALRARQLPMETAHNSNVRVQL